MSLIVPNLWLGPIDHIHDISFLQEHNITHILSIHEKHVVTWPMLHLHIKHMYVKLRDADEEPIGDYFETTTAFIKEALASGGAVYVHCFMGISRSPTIVAAYLIREKGMTADEALNFLQVARSIVDPNDGFRAALEVCESHYSSSSIDPTVIST